MIDARRIVYVTTLDPPDHNFSHKCWKRALAGIGVQLLFIDKHDNISESIARTARHSDDLFLINVKLRLVPENLGLNTWPNPKILLESDAFLNFADAAPESMSLLGKLDRILQYNNIAGVVVRDAYSCERIRQAGRFCVWSPHAAQPEDCCVSGVARTVDAAFVGTTTPWMYPERRSLIKAVRDAVPGATIFDESHRVPDSEYIEALNRAKLFVTSPIGPEGIPRVTEAKFYEAMLAGCCVVRRRTFELDRLGFVPGEHYVSFTTHADLKAKLQALLRDEDERERIARNGTRFVCAYHTWGGRAAHLLVDLAGS